MSTSTKKFEMRVLDVALDGEELSARMEALARVTMEEEGLRESVDAMKEGHAAEVKRLNTSIEGLHKEREKHARAITTRKVEKDVKCEWNFSIQRGIAVLIRTDTGAILQRRDLTDDEKQLVLGQELAAFSAEVENALAVYESQLLREAEPPEPDQTDEETPREPEE